ncbi:hypothetical protein [Streptomyces flavofungini]|uniref:hypothetical protein n=1 Tax=Streptomyces flavofungini TaxID=68200 RepID=UPI0034DF78A1
MSGSSVSAAVRPFARRGGGLARQLSQHDPADGSRALARSLLDRSAFRIAACEFGPALDDFRQALRCMED